MSDWGYITKQLRTALSSDRASGKVFTNNVGKISHLYYAKLLGVALNTLNRNCYHVFAEYECGATPLLERLMERLKRDEASGNVSIGADGRVNLSHYACELGVARIALSVVCETGALEMFGPRSGLLSERLREALHRDALGKKLVFGRRGRIARAHYAKILGVSVFRLKQQCSVVLAEHEASSPDLAGHLRKTIERDVASREVVVCSGGMVNRSHYARSLGVPLTSMNRRCGDIFAWFDNVLLKIPDQLRIMLKTDKGGRGVVLSSSCMINRAHYAKRLGVTAAFLSLRCKDVFFEHEAEMPSIEEQLRALLDRDCDSGGAVASRSGLINRAHYAKIIGITPSALGYYKEVFSEYEGKYQIETGPLVKFDEMMSYLETNYRSGQLGYLGGKVDRKKCLEKVGFGGAHSVISKYPEIKRLFESFDERAKDELYIPSATRLAAERVQKWLKAPILNADRRTVNRKKLVKALGIKPSVLSDPHIAVAITAVQDRVLEKAHSSLSDPYFEGRVFSFSRLHSLWPRAFIERVGSRFKTALSGSGSPKSEYLILHRLLEWIGSDIGPVCRSLVADAKTNGKILNKQAWESALFSFGAIIIDEAGSNHSAQNTAKSRIKSLRRCLRALASGQVTPGLDRPLRNIKIRNTRGRRRLKSVAEVVARDQNGKVEHYIDFARAQFGYACQLINSPTDDREQELFLGSIRDELAQQASLSESVSDAVLTVLRNRTMALRKQAEDIVQAGRIKLARGATLIAEADIDSVEFEKRYCAEHLNKRQKTNVLREIFPYPFDKSETARNRSVANLLKLVSDRLGGMLPYGSTPVRGYGHFFKKRYIELGGTSELEGFLFPDPDTVGAVLTLYLIEGGANISVGRTLDRTCITTSDQSGYVRITGHKARAKGKPIYVDLRGESVAVSSMEWMQKAMMPLASLGGTDGDRLFLMRLGGRIQLMKSHWYTNWFKRFVASVPALSRLALLPSMVRPSILLSAALSNDGRLQMGLAIGQHGLNETQGYQNKWPTRLLYDQQIRRFQNDLETLLAISLPDAAARLGITEDELRSRLDRIAPTGLGTFCSNLQNVDGLKGRLCQSMNCWDRCPHLLIIAEIDAIAALQLWQRSLREAAPEWERDRPDRWEKVWLPWLCLVDVVEEMMSRGPLLKIWKAATARVADLTSSHKFVAYKPW